MFDVKELDRWKPVGKGLRFTSVFPRPIRLEVLSEDEARLYVKEGKAPAQFIGWFRGYDVVQFRVSGAFDLTTDGEGVKVWTTDMETGAVEIPDAVAFTTMMARRARNPELEIMMQKMTVNLDRRLAQVTNDLSLEFNRQARETERENQRKIAELAAAAEAKRTADGQQSVEDASADEAAKIAAIRKAAGIV